MPSWKERRIFKPSVKVKVCERYDKGCDIFRDARSPIIKGSDHGIGQILLIIQLITIHAESLMDVSNHELTVFVTPYIDLVAIWIVGVELL